jgi:hypothetical protein
MSEVIKELVFLDEMWKINTCLFTCPALFVFKYTLIINRHDFFN